MGGKVWSVKEEEVFWTRIVPRSAKGLTLAKTFDPKTWGQLADEMQRLMGRESKRDYKDMMMFEHYFHNAMCKGKPYSPNAAKWAHKYRIQAGLLDRVEMEAEAKKAERRNQKKAQRGAAHKAAAQRMPQRDKTQVVSDRVAAQIDQAAGQTVPFDKSSQQLAPLSNSRYTQPQYPQQSATQRRQPYYPDRQQAANQQPQYEQAQYQQAQYQQTQYQQTQYQQPEYRQPESQQYASAGSSQAGSSSNTAAAPSYPATTSMSASAYVQTTREDSQMVLPYRPAPILEPPVPQNSASDNRNTTGYTQSYHQGWLPDLRASSQQQSAPNPAYYLPDPRSSYYPPPGQSHMSSSTTSSWGLVNYAADNCYQSPATSGAATPSDSSWEMVRSSRSNSDASGRHLEDLYHWDDPDALAE